MNSNQLYYEWGLLGVLSGILIMTMIAGFVWLLRLDSKTAKIDSLKIKGALTGLFQKTVIIECRNLLTLIHNRLPYLLSHSSYGSGQPPPFDMLVEGFKTFDVETENPRRDLYERILTDSLSDVLISEVDSILRSSESIIDGSTSAVTRTPVIPLAFQEETEKKLRFIARNTVLAGKKEIVFNKSRRLAIGFFISSVFAVVLLSPLFLINKAWAFYLSLFFLTGFMISFLPALVLCARVHGSLDWLGRYAVQSDNMLEWYNNES